LPAGASRLTLPRSTFRSRRATQGASAPLCHPSYAVGSRANAPHFALRGTSAPDTTGLHRGSFGLNRPAQHELAAFARPQRLLTSCAHRLRKPHRTTRPSDALCRRTGAEPSAPRSLSLASRLPARSMILPGCPPARLRVCHGGFRTMASQNQDACVGSTSDLAIESGLRALPFTFARAHPHPFTHRVSTPVVTGGRRVKLTLAGFARPKASFACQERCVYPTSATDPRHEHPRDRSTLESPPAQLSPRMAASTPPGA